MNDDDVKNLVEAFRGYRDLLNPIQNSLNDFVGTYDLLRDDIDKLNTAFGGDVQANLEKIYKNLSAQAAKATDLASQIDRFVGVTAKYSTEVTKLLELFSRVEEKITSINSIEAAAEEQLGKLDALMEERKKSVNVKELQRTLDSYNDNVQRVGAFLDKGVHENLQESLRTLDAIKSGNDNLAKRLEEEKRGLDTLATAYATNNELLTKLIQNQDVNEAYLYDVLDAWAESRHIKKKK